MTQFGQATPSVPHVYEDFNTYTETKAAFVSHMVKALKTVGMVPLYQSWPWDPIAFPEQVVPTSTVALFPFDYPDTATFNFGGATWRPCVVICAWFGDYTTSAGPNNSNNYLVLFDAIRKDGPFNISNMYIFERERTPANVSFGFGSGAQNFPTTHAGSAGAEVNVADWKPYASFVGNDQTLLTTSHWYAYLGSAGLFFYVGQGATQAQFGNKLAVGFIFGGGRIPGREQVPDPDLNHTCPVFPLYMRESGAGSRIYDTSTGRLRTIIHGIQYLGKFNQYPVRAYLFNEANVERPVFSDFAPFTHPSPVAVAGGGGAHILGRVVIVPNTLENNNADFYSRIESSISNTEVRPLWGEVYTCPAFRLCDLTTPLGDHEDPVTLINWQIVPFYATGQLLALKSENMVYVSSLSFGSITQTGDFYYNMIGTPNAGTSFTFPNLPGGVIAPVVTNTTTGGTIVKWDDTQNGALDQVLGKFLIATNGQSATADWVCQQPGGDTEDTLYSLALDMKNLGIAGTEGVNPVSVFVFFQGAYPGTANIVLNSAGTNSGAAGFNFVTYTVQLTVDSTITTQKNLRFKLVLGPTTVAATGNTVTVKNVHVLKYRYL